jgi:vaccinia related kinase
MVTMNLIDHQGACWSLDEQLFKGGFGFIYSCVANDKVVVKIQPKSDDQLRKEELFYRDLYGSKFSDVVSKYIPDLVTFGIANNLRFIVIERFECDLQRFINTNVIAKETKCNMAKQLISALEFIHSFGYSHGDLKAQNILVKHLNNEIVLYVTDFGLVHKFMNKLGNHVSYIPGKLCRHRGTLPFISEDSHVGVIPSRRSDLENMGWLLISSIFCGNLPWAKLNNKTAVLNSKVKTKNHLKGSENILIKMIPGQSHQRLLKYMVNVISLEYEEEPNYSKLELIFEVDLPKII